MPETAQVETVTVVLSRPFAQSMIGLLNSMIQLLNFIKTKQKLFADHIKVDEHHLNGLALLHDAIEQSIKETHEATTTD